MNRDEELLQHPIYQDFQEDQPVDVEIVAVVVVPGKIVIGICFPEHPVDNKCPHVTLLTNDCPAKDSNRVLELTCLGPKKPFSSVYRDLKRKHAQGVKEDEEEKEKEETEEPMEVVEGKVKINQSDNAQACFFVTLREKVAFRTAAKVYFA